MSHITPLKHFRPTPIHPVVNRLSKNTQTILSWLLWHRNSKTGQCNPRIETLAKECNCSVATVNRALRQLRQAGIIETDRSYRASSYRITEEERWRRLPRPPKQLSLFAPEPRQKPVLIHHSAVKNDISFLTLFLAAILTELTKLSSEPKGAPAAAQEASGIPENRAPEPAVVAAPPPVEEQRPKHQHRTPPAKSQNEQLLRDLQKVHPMPGNSRRAAAELDAVLAGGTTEQEIRTSHAQWCRWWKAKPRYVPQLWRWFNEGEWEMPPNEDAIAAANWRPKSFAEMDDESMNEKVLALCRSSK